MTAGLGCSIFHEVVIRLVGVPPASFSSFDILGTASSSSVSRYLTTNHLLDTFRCCGWGASSPGRGLHITRKMGFGTFKLQGQSCAFHESTDSVDLSLCRPVPRVSSIQRKSKATETTMLRPLEAKSYLFGCCSWLVESRRG